MFAYGEIVLVAGGAYSSKPRPVLILQNPEYKTGNSVIIVPFTSKHNADIATRIMVTPDSINGLDRNCFLEIDKLSAIDVSYIKKRVGALDDITLRKTAELAQSLITCPS